MHDTYEELRLAYADGTKTLNDDEYIGENGLPYCKLCNTPKWTVLQNDIVVPIACKHIQDERDREHAEYERQKRYDAFILRQNASMLGNRYKAVTFDKARITDNNRRAYEKCRTYADKAADMLKNNVGLYIYGGNSTGKTYLSACLCNALMWSGYSCLSTSLANILIEILSKDSNSLGEAEIFRRLEYSSFVFIDDLGKEFIGRTYNSSRAVWAEEKLFEVINKRYNAQMPTIFTSNYSVNDLKTLNLDSGIIDRIIEMSTVVLKLDGENFRNDNRDKTRQANIL